MLTLRSHRPCVKLSRVQNSQVSIVTAASVDFWAYNLLWHFKCRGFLSSMQITSLWGAQDQTWIRILCFSSKTHRFSCVRLAPRVNTYCMYLDIWLISIGYISVGDMYWPITDCLSSRVNIKRLFCLCVSWDSRLFWLRSLCKIRLLITDH